VPDVELRADYDRDGRLSGSKAEYAARTVGHGAILGVNVDRDGHALAKTPRAGKPVSLDYALPTKDGHDGDPVPLQLVVKAPALARFSSLALLVSGENAESVALLDSHRRVLRPARTAPGEIEFALPLKAGKHAFALEASRVPGSPLGASDGALTVSVVGRDPAGTASTVDAGRVLLARFLVLDDLAPAETLYICTLPDNDPSVADVRAALAAVRPAVGLREIALTDNLGDAWVQDQFQLGYVLAPGRTMRTVLHMPRLRTNAKLGVDQRNLATLVRTHFPSTDLGLIEDFWGRTVPLRHSGGVTQLTFVESEAAFRVLRRVASANRFLRDVIERLCASAGKLGISPAPPECSNMPPPFDTIAPVRMQLPELRRRVLALVDRLVSEVPPSDEAGLRTVAERARRLVDDVERTLTVSGGPNAEVFGLVLGKTTFQLDGGDLVDLFTTVERMHDSLVYGGNLEASPPLAGHPYGKVVLGEGNERLLDPPVRDLFESGAGVQPVVTVDTAWLGVGHVDELIAFLPDRATKGHSILRASPEVASALMDAASRLYQDGLPDLHLDRDRYLWRPLTLVRHRMHEGEHPVTRMLRGKLWLHSQPRLRPPPEGGTPDAGSIDDAGEVLLPPHIYLFLVDFYSGLFSSDLAPFFPDSDQDVYYYRAGLTTWDFDFFSGATNRVLVEEKLGPLDKLLAAEFPSFPVRRVPVLFDEMLLNDKSPRVAGTTAAFTPNLVNLQFLNGTVLIPKPFGPRMSPPDATAVVTEVLRDQGLGKVAGRVSVSYFKKQKLDVTEIWLNPKLSSGRVDTPLETVDDLAEEFADGFPGLSRKEVASRIRKANPTAFDGSGRLKKGWRLIRIPERTVDLFQAYTHALLDAQGLHPRWVDSWFYHVRLGEIHCGTNVLRKVPKVKTPWWNRVGPQPAGGSSFPLSGSEVSG
jgi:hypothetical protein